jgi:NDP-sugar pyrophosphorylase family protein
MAERRIIGELHKSFWLDVGTPERLAALEYKLEKQN